MRALVRIMRVSSWLDDSEFGTSLATSSGHHLWLVYYSASLVKAVRVDVTVIAPSH